jgi:hypothetical protein
MALSNGAKEAAVDLILSGQLPLDDDVTDTTTDAADGTGSAAPAAAQETAEPGGGPCSGSGASTGAGVASVDLAAVGSSGSGSETEDEDEDDEDSPVDFSAEELLEVDTKRSIFDAHGSAEAAHNLAYMHKRFGFFLPDLEYLVDPTGMLRYAALKVKAGRTCLYCQRVFGSSQACVGHMRDKVPVHSLYLLFCLMHCCF